MLRPQEVDEINESALVAALLRQPTKPKPNSYMTNISSLGDLLNTKKGNPMLRGKYFDYKFDNSFAGKCKTPSWNRTEGVERQLCNLLNESRNAPITYTQVRAITGWGFLLIRRWFAELLTAGVFTDADTPRTQRWRLSRDFPDDRESLVELIPPIGSTIVSRKQECNQAKAESQSSPQVKTVTTVDDEECSLPSTGIDEDDDFFSVFSR